MTKSSAFLQRLRRAVRGKSLQDEPLRNHTSFHVGGPADILFYPVDGDDAAAALEAAYNEGEQVFIMGNGTNLLVRDGGIRGLTLHTGALQGIEEENDADPGEGGKVPLSALSGTFLSRIINYSVGRGLSGLEFAAGIPGTVGGAACMNAGAHGSSFGDIVAWAEVADMEGRTHCFRKEEIEFSYRGSRWPCEGVITKIGFSLFQLEEAKVLEKVKHCLSERGKRLPLGVGMAGSVFKNPEGDFAGRIIESVGLKGRRVGQTEISRKHANVIVNLGGGTAREILQLVEEVARKVKDETGIGLETEIKCVGEDAR